jgi:cellobiose-specific phosphotransferase system component IIB
MGSIEGADIALIAPQIKYIIIILATRRVESSLFRTNTESMLCD